ncbi:MCR_0457 family protein [Acinetobacter sp. KS-LM10]|uniref:MCR_0457 family protein n=1 Tax=Acinetobacter sp. KS-LM10 TaxID=3120518 RepID=UPI0030CF3214
MQNKLTAMLAAGILSTSFAMSSTAFAEQNKADIKENIEVTQQNVTKDELAAIYVLSEVCPPLVPQDDKFKAGYNSLLKDYLPNEKSPDAALKSLVKQSAFKTALEQARLDAKTAGEQGNKKVCNDVKDYQS